MSFCFARVSFDGAAKPAVGQPGLPKFEDLEVPLCVEGGRDRRSRSRPLKYNYKPLEVKSGALVVFHGNLWHTGEANKSQKSRIAFKFSIVYGDAKYPEDS